MENNNNVQLILPFDIEQEPEYKAIIKQNWQFTFSRQIITSVYTKRVVGLIIAQMKESGEFKPYYQIRAADIISETDLDRAEVYKRLKTVILELDSVVYYIENEKKGVFIPRRLLDTTRYENPAGYNQGVLTVAFNPMLKDVILELAHYTEYQLGTYMRFSSWYSMRLWEMLSTFKDTGWMELNIDEYREFMGCGVTLNPKTQEPIIDKRTKKPKVKYPEAKDLIKKTTAEPLKEFANTELAFVVKGIEDKEKIGKGRRPIVKVRFDITYKKPSAADSIKSWCEQSPIFKRTVERLRKYKLSDENIAKYSKAIGELELAKLLHNWDLRQMTDSKDKILTPIKFCNKVICDMGEKALKQANGKE